MIKRNETILNSLTDSVLQEASRSASPPMAYRAKSLLSVPPEYRQGIEARTCQLMTVTRSVHTQHGVVLEASSSGVSLERAYSIALYELHAQLRDESGDSVEGMDPVC